MKARKRKRFLYERGVRQLLDSTPVRERIEQLRLVGVTQADISHSTGVAERTLYMINNGTTKRVHRRTYEAVMGFERQDADLVRNEKIVDATATRYRVEALVALGYRQSWIAHQLGRKYIGLDIGERVTRRRALDVLDLCVRVGDEPGPSKKAAVQARNKGWRKPIDFDADLFYDPHWNGDESELYESSRAEQLLEDYDFIQKTADVSMAEAAERLGIKKDSLEHLLRRRSKRVA